MGQVMALDEGGARPRLLIKSGAVLAAVFAGFVARSALHLDPSVVALLGAGLLVVVSDLSLRDYMPNVEWEVSALSGVVDNIRYALPMAAVLRSDVTMARPPGRFPGSRLTSMI